MKNLAAELEASGTAFEGQWHHAFALASAGRCIGQVWRQTSVARPPKMRQQLVDLAIELHGHAREDVFQIDPRVVPVEFGRLQQACHHRRVLPRQLAANEQPVAPPQGRAGFGFHKNCCPVARRHRSEIDPAPSRVSGCNQ